MNISLSKNINSPRSKYLVFTSAGDNANLHLWLEGYRNFDLWVIYYGDNIDTYKNDCDFHLARKGGKFPNLHYVYKHWENILNHYQAILVMDDDIVIDSPAISALFEIREQNDLWVLQPAFDPRGKISHRITQVNPFTIMRFTNFVEVTCPLFRKDKLDDFIKVYDPELIGWGVDWWFLDSLSPNIEGKVAIIDAISCINPHDSMKGDQREIELLQDTPTRISNWGKIKSQYNIQSEARGFMEFDSVQRPLNFFNIMCAIKILLIQGANIIAKIIKDLKRHTL